MSRRSDRCTPEFRAAVGGRIRALRKTRGLTLRQLAGVMGTSFVGLHQIETGKSEPTATTVVMLAGALDCTTDHLLKGSG